MRSVTLGTVGTVGTTESAFFRNSLSRLYYHLAFAGRDMWDC